MDLDIRSEFYVDDEPLSLSPESILSGNYGYWVTDAQKLHGPNNLNIQTVKLGGRFGEQVIPGTHTAGPAAFSLTMSYCANTYGLMMQIKSEVEAMLAPAGRPVTIRETDDDWLDICADAYLTGTSIGSMWDDVALHGIDVEYTFTIPSGVWRNRKHDHIRLSNGGIFDDDFEQDGSAPRFDNEIEVSLDPGGECTIENTNHDDTFITITNPTDGFLSVTVDTRTGIATSGNRVVQNYVTIGSRAFFIDPKPKIKANGSGFDKVHIYSYAAWY